MAYPHEHILVRFHGHFGGTSTIADRWSVGVRMGLPTQAPAYDPAKLQTLVNSCQTAANTLMNTGGAGVGTATFLDYVSGAQIGALGRYSPSTQLTVLSPTITTAGLGTPVQPWNAALVVSLRTGIPRGRGSNGRLYWPAQALTPAAATGRIPTANVATRLNLFKTFLDACNTAANAYSAGMRVVVASSIGGGLLAVVTGIRSDDRLDTIERRENDQPSAWSTATLA